MLPRTLETERLVLRPWRLADVEAVLRYASDAAWSRYLPVSFPYVRDEAEDFVARQRITDWATAPAWCIGLPPSGEAIGGVDLRFEMPHRAAIGFSLARAHWNRGLVTEAARAVIDAAFLHCPELHKVFAFCDVRHDASLRVQEKLGMEREGLLRKHFRHRNELVDAIQSGLLRSDWEARRRGLQA